MISISLSEKFICQNLITSIQVINMTGHSSKSTESLRLIAEKTVGGPDYINLLAFISHNPNFLNLKRPFFIQMIFPSQKDRGYIFIMSAKISD